MRVVVPFSRLSTPSSARVFGGAVRRHFVGEPPEGAKHRVVFLRHGQSEWNAKKRFTGWVDVDLSERGRDEAIHAGLMLERHGFEFDEAHTSLLKRAVRTLWSVLHSCDQHWIEVKRSWRLNERHYGALQGMSKEEVKRRVGEELLQNFRRGFDKMPTPMRENHPFWTGKDRRYRTIGPSAHPTGESLRMCQQRVLPYWQDAIVPSIRRGSRVLVAAHNNVIRCIVQYLDKIPVDRIREIECPTGVPIVYDLDENLNPLGEATAVGFRGKFLVDHDKRDEEYRANLACILERQKDFDTRVDPENLIRQEDLRDMEAQCSLDSSSSSRPLITPTLSKDPANKDPQQTPPPPHAAAAPAHNETRRAP